MEEKKSTNPLKVSLVFGRDEWTQAQRQMFMDAFSQSVERQAIQLWTGTLRRLPRGLAYKIEDTESNLNMLKLSFAPGFEGAPLRLSAHINIPETIRAHQKVEFQEEVERTHEKIEKDWVIRYLLPVIGWVLQIADRETKIEDVKRDFIKDVDEKIDERSREKAKEFWVGHALEPVLSCLVHASVDAINALGIPGELERPIMLEANGKNVMLSLSGTPHFVVLPEEKRVVFAA